MTFDEYRRRMLFLYGAIEETDGEDIEEQDPGIATLEQAIALSEGRALVAEIAAEKVPAWITERKEITWPDAETLNLFSPNSVLPRVPLAIIKIEELYGTNDWRMLREINVTDREKYTQVGSTASRSLGYVYDGAHLELLPLQAEGRQIRITYVPDPGEVHLAEIQSGAEDLLLPPQLHFAVPVAAAMCLAVKDEARRERLEARWIETIGRIERRAGIRTTTPRFRRFTRLGRIRV